MSTSVKITCNGASDRKKVEVMVIVEGQPPERKFLRNGESTTVALNENSSIRVNESSDG
jgi:hypothetical protein